MDGTFGGGDLISASLAIMLGGTDAELHEKSVFFSLAMITASETGIFEYDPQDEPPSGRPPGPWDGYDFFTVDLSTVKDNIEDMLARIAALEDELEDCHGCWEDVVAKLQEYDPDYDPAEGECPTEEIGKVVDEKEHEIETLEEQIEECNQCKADVIAKLQEYDPDFDPQTCSDIPPEVDKIVDEHEGYKFPVGTPYPPIAEIVGKDELTDEDVGITIGIYESVDTTTHSGQCTPYYVLNGEIYYLNGVGAQFLDHFENATIKVIDPTTGEYSGGVDAYWTYSSTPTHFTFSGTNSNLIGYGDSSHTYSVKNS